MNIFNFACAIERSWTSRWWMLLILKKFQNEKIVYQRFLLALERWCYCITTQNEKLFSTYILTVAILFFLFHIVFFFATEYNRLYCIVKICCCCFVVVQKPTDHNHHIYFMYFCLTREFAIEDHHIQSISSNSKQRSNEPKYYT